MSAGADGYVARAMRRLAPYTSRFICISDYVRSLMRSYGLAEDQLALIPCSTNLDVEKEFPSKLRQEHRIGEEALVIGTTGVWRPNKGFPYFIAAGELLLPRYPLTKFLLGGRAYGPDSAFATSLWMRGMLLRATNSLIYTGWQEDIGSFLSALDIFVLPSDCEPFGLVVIEAMARGIPVVATRAGGMPELIEHGRSGVLVPPQNPEAMADALDFLLADPVLRLQIGESGKARVQRWFGRERMLAAYMDLYERTAAPAGRKA